MATRKKKTLLPVTWLRQLRQRLTSRMACFVWGAIFGNAVLNHPISPLNLILEPPERMLNAVSREWVDAFRLRVRELSHTFTGSATQLLREKAASFWPTASGPNTHVPAGSGWGTQVAAVGAAVGVVPKLSAGRSLAFAECKGQFPAQTPLDLTSVDIRWQPTALCSDGFAVLYSGLTKTPMVAVEKLNRQRLQQAAGQTRTDQFYADARVQQSARATLSDYQGSGFDRGHLAAAANQATPESMAQSFALTNMVPQDPVHNRKVWAKLEADTRKYALRATGDVYVFSGVLNEGATRKVGSNGVWVPSHLFKLVYDAAQQRAWAYVLPNHAQAQLGRPMDYASFVQRTQWALLDGMPVTGTIR